MMLEIAGGVFLGGLALILVALFWRVALLIGIACLCLAVLGAALVGWGYLGVLFLVPRGSMLESDIWWIWMLFPIFAGAIGWFMEWIGKGGSVPVDKAQRLKDEMSSTIPRR